MTRLRFYLITLIVLSSLVIAGAAFGATMTFSSMSSCCPSNYSEAGFNVSSWYGGSQNGGHLHGSSGGLSIHGSCCSTPYRFTKSGGGTFNFDSYRNVSGSGTLVGSNGASVSVGGSGVQNLGSTFTNVSWVEWRAGGGVIDDVGLDTCTAPNSAQAGGPYSVNEGSSVTLTGSGSGQATLSYNWDFTGNGTYNNASGTSVSFNAASSAGSVLDGVTSHTVGLQVTSNSCAGSSTDTATINVANVNPTASATIPSSGTEGATLNFSSSATDPGPDTFTYAWTFGDGDTSSLQNPTHKYDDNGSYTATVTITDDDGGSDSVTATVAITNVVPTITSVSGDQNVVEGSSGSYSAVTDDVSTADLAAGLTYAWTMTGPSGPATSASATPSFTYTDDGAHTVSLVVTDKDGGVSATTSIAVTVTNANPTASISGPTSGNEGQSLSFTGSATDPGADTFTYAWNFGDGGTATGASVSHTYVDEGSGSYTVTLTVTDDDGGTDTATQVVTVSNVNPTIDTFVVPNSGVEAGPLSFSSTASDVGVNDALSFLWDFGDGNTSTSANPVHTYLDEGTGTYTVSLTVNDGDNGSATQSTTISVANVNPVAGAIVGPLVGNEAQVLSWTGGGTDVGTLDTLTFAWDFGDGNNATGTSASHAYNQDGTYTITFTVTDNDGGTDSTTITVVISNTPPAVTSITPATTGDEGSTLSFTATATDASSIDQANLTWAWEWDDQTPNGIGSTASHAWDDEGSYTVTATVTDTGGLTDTDTVAVTINNVAPTIVTNAPGFGNENVLYTYAAAATDPGADTLTWSLSASSPAGATIDPSTGLIEWTPTFAQTGPNSFVVTVDDGDGGQDVQSFTVIVGFEDLDNDGMADTWETDNGLDPTDPSDAGLDPDGDGLTNLDEFLNGQDPNVSDLPDPPVLVWPIQGEEIDDPRPTLEWLEAVDPNGDALTYDVEVYEDSTMAVLVTSVSGVADLTWALDVLLANENGTYYWRVRAHDGWGYSLWADLEDFFLNEFNEPPEPPTAIFPVDGEETTLTPIVDMVEGPDPDNDAVGHTIRLWNADGSELLSEAWMAPGARNVNWPVNVPLEEDTWYLWDAQAEDEHGLQSDWIEPEPFFSTGENAPPLDVFWTAPDDGSYVESASPVMLYTLSEDPEGRDVDYEIDLDTADTFDSGDLVSFVQVEADNGVLDLEADGTALAENSWWNARVRAIDTDQGTSAWDTIRFFVRGDNDAPPTPVLVSPEDGATLTTRTPVLAVAHVDDPEEDLVIYEILVTTDLDGTDIITAGNGLLGSAGPEGTADQTSWQVDVNLTGPVYWTARAVDERGAASAWAEPWMLTLDTGEPEGPSLDDILTGGCAACSGEASLASADNPAGFLAIALMLLVPAVRRRR